MTPEKLQQIFTEAEPDFSAQICNKASFDDLDHRGIELFREKWHRRSGNDELLNLSTRQLLEDSELIIDGGITHAALVLFGTQKQRGQSYTLDKMVFFLLLSEKNSQIN